MHNQNGERRHFPCKNPAGGGYGNPLERYPEPVHRDVLDGLVSLEVAKKDYGVVINPVTMEIDWKFTEQLRLTEGNV